MSGNSLPQNSLGQTSDIGVLWQAALDRYEQVTGFKVQLLEGSNDLDAVLAQVQEKSSLFESRRHDTSKADRFRSLIKESLGPVLVLGEVVVHATKLVFPPVEAIFAAAKYLIGVANTVSAGYDKVSAFFQDLKSYLHQLRTLENKLPAIPQLQVAIIDVFASVLVLCGVCAKYVRTKRIAVAFRSLMGSKNDDLTVAFSEFERMVKQEQDVVTKAILAGVTRLQSDTQVVNLNVSKGIAVSQDIQRDTKDLTIRTANIDRSIQRREERADRERILNWFTNIDFHSKQKAAFAKHQEGTGRWLLDAVAFQKWAFGPDDTILWCPGIPGAGKTVMMSKVVDYVFNRTDRSSVAITYVYCNYKDPDTHSEVGLLSSITRQLVEQTGVIPPGVLKFWEKYIEAKRYPTTEERILLINEICGLFARCYIFVDALDECPEGSRERFLRMLTGLCPPIRLLVTSRPHIPIKAKFPNAYRIDIIADQDDLQRYTESQVASRARLGDLVSTRPALKSIIIDKLSQNAAGMFLLCELYMHRVCECTTVSQVLRSLESLPAKISELYGEAFDRICSQSENDKLAAQRAISYITCAKRPMTVDELRHALSVKTGDTDLDENDLPLTKILLIITAGLIQVDEKTQMATLVHHTLQEYLEENRVQMIRNHETELAVACITYLSFESFASGPCVKPIDFDRRLEEFPFLEYASHHWGSHATGLREHEHLAILGSFLRDDLKVSSYTQVQYISRSKLRGQHARFPKQRGHLHVLAYWGMDEILESYFPECLNVDSKDSFGWTALHIAAQQGHVNTMRLLLAKNARSELTTNRGESALYWAARNGHMAAVTLLLNAGADTEARDSEGWTALDWAAMRGHNNVVQAILLRYPAKGFGSEGVDKALILSAEAGNAKTLELLLHHGAEIDFEDADGSTALMWAVPEGHEFVVSLLLDKGANAKAKDTYSNTPLHWAIPYERIARLLISRGADVDAKNDDGQTALDWCAQDGQFEVLRLLLENGADARSQDKFGFTALHAAALKGHEVMVQLLTERGADPDLQDRNGWTALHTAAIRKHTGVAQFLKERTKGGARIVNWVAVRQNDVSRQKLLNFVAEKKSEGSTAITGLRWAVSEGREERVRAMLDGGAHIDAEDVGGCTALTIGAYMRQETTVRLLLNYGADANRPERSGMTALQVASELGYLGVVRCLVEHRADMNVEASSWTALLLAARNGHSEVVHYLATEGAYVQARDYHMRTAMHWAAMRGSLMELQTLIHMGAEVDAVDRWGRTPLMWAVENQESEAALLLLRGGAAPASKAEDGSTALHIATLIGDEHLVRELTKQGANIQEKTRDGVSPLNIAIFRGNLRIAKILLALHGSPSAKKRCAGLESKANDVTSRDIKILFDDGGDQDDDKGLDQRTPSLSTHFQRMCDGL